jgi:2-C-methyl-D-erythritol 2,4-cyclodiphosphate synthase
MIKIGHGYDSHRYENGEYIIIGGVKISSKRAIVAHSDGDILIHALCDALLGAAGKGDMGSYYDSSEKYKNIDSTIFLQETMQIVYSDGYSIINIDATVVTEEPAISKHAIKIKKSLSKILKINEEQINIKSKSNDKLGYVGRKEGIEVHVILLIEKI